MDDYILRRSATKVGDTYHDIIRVAKITLPTVLHYGEEMQKSEEYVKNLIHGNNRTAWITVSRENEKYANVSFEDGAAGIILRKLQEINLSQDNAQELFEKAFNDGLLEYRLNTITEWLKTGKITNYHGKEEKIDSLVPMEILDSIGLVLSAKGINYDRGQVSDNLLKMRLLGEYGALDRNSISIENFVNLPSELENLYEQIHAIDEVCRNGNDKGREKVAKLIRARMEDGHKLDPAFIRPLFGEDRWLVRDVDALENALNSLNEINGERDLDVLYKLRKWLILDSEKYEQDIGRLPPEESFNWFHRIEFERMPLVIHDYVKGFDQADVERLAILKKLCELKVLDEDQLQKAVTEHGIALPKHYEEKLIEAKKDSRFELAKFIKSLSKPDIVDGVDLNIIPAKSPLEKLVQCVSEYISNPESDTLAMQSAFNTYCNRYSHGLEDLRTLTNSFISSVQSIRGQEGVEKLIEIIINNHNPINYQQEYFEGLGMIGGPWIEDEKEIAGQTPTNGIVKE